MAEKCLTEKDLTEKLMIEEYKVLRQEHENNRKFVFERPLILLAFEDACFVFVYPCCILSSRVSEIKMHSRNLTNACRLT